MAKEPKPRGRPKAQPGAPNTVDPEFAQNVLQLFTRLEGRITKLEARQERTEALWRGIRYSTLWGRVRTALRILITGHWMRRPPDDVWLKD